MEQFLPIELVEKIYRIKHQMEMKNLKNYIIYYDIFMIKDYNIGYGLVFDGAKTFSIGEEKGYGIFIKATKPHSIADKKENVKKGWQIIEMNGSDLTDATFYELKEALLLRNRSLIMRIKYNPKLLENYSFKT